MSVDTLSLFNRFITQSPVVIDFKEAFEKAIRTGDLASVKEIVKKGFFLNWPLLQNQCPLNLALQENQIEIALFLIESGANPELPGLDKLNAVDHAALSGNQTLLAHILRVKLGKDLKEIEKQLKKKSQLREFSSLKRGDFLSWKFGSAIKNFFERLDREGLDPVGGMKKAVHEMANGAGIQPDKMTSLSRDAYRGRLEGKRNLGPAVVLNWKDPNGYTPLHYAILGNEQSSFDQLIAAGADFRVLTEAGQTLLHFATIAGSKQMVERLLELGLDPNLADRDGDTPLHCAAIQGRLSHLEILVKKGGRIDLCNQLELSPLALVGASSSDKDPLKLNRLQLILFAGASVTWLSQMAIASGWASNGVAMAAVNLAFMAEFLSSLIDSSLIPISDPTWRFLLPLLRFKFPWLELPLRCASAYYIGLSAVEGVKLCFKNLHRKKTAFRNLFVHTAIAAHSCQRVFQKCYQTFFSSEPNTESPGPVKPVCRELTSERIEQLKTMSPQDRVLDPDLDPNCPTHNLVVLDPHFLAEIRTKWKNLSLVLHPDKNHGDPRAGDAMVRANQARDYFIPK